MPLQSTTWLWAGCLRKMYLNVVWAVGTRLGVWVSVWRHAFLSATGCRGRVDFALLFHLYRLVCVAFDWSVNHCAFGPLRLWQRLEKRRRTCWCPSGRISGSPWCTAVLTVSMQLEGSRPCCFLKTAGRASVAPLPLSAMSLSPQRPISTCNTCFSPCILNLLTRLYFEELKAFPCVPHPFPPVPGLLWLERVRLVKTLQTVCELLFMLGRRPCGGWVTRHLYTCKVAFAVISTRLLMSF